VQSQNEPCQFLITPLSMQKGQRQWISPDSWSRSISISPGHGLRPGRRRHLTIGFVDSSDVSRVAPRTSLERNSPSLRADPVTLVMDPSSVKKCVRSVIHVDPIFLFC
jgi:hypothetical protein